MAVKATWHVKLTRRDHSRTASTELIAWSPDGMTEAMLLAQGFTVEMLVDLIRAGLATAKAERVIAGA